MNDKRNTVTAQFKTVEAALQAARSLRNAGLHDATVYSPFQNHEIEAETGRAVGPVSLLALLGAMTGAGLGLSLTIGTSVQHPTMTGGQPIVSLPPFLVITFEMTILFGVLGTVVGMFWGIWRGKSKKASYHSRFSVDRIGLAIECSMDKVATARDLLSQGGAEEVRDEKF